VLVKLDVQNPFRKRISASSTLAPIAALPGEDETPSAGEFGGLWRIIRLALRYRFRLAITIIATIAAAIFQLLVPPLLGDAVDGALGLLETETVSPDIARAALVEAYLCAAMRSR
jgi:hypothetical protein